MALGNICTLGTILERRSYVTDMAPIVVEECLVARWHYKQIRLWFQRQYAITVGGTMVMPSSVFSRSLVEFMAGVVDHKYLYVSEVPEIEGCSAEVVNRRVLNLILSDYPELEPAFTDLLEVNHHRWSWVGPEIEIRRREEDDDLAEAMEFEDFVLFPEEDELDSDGDSSESQDRRTTSGQKKRKRGNTQGEKSHWLRV
jgi:hypothetical protein